MDRKQPSPVTVWVVDERGDDDGRVLRISLHVSGPCDRMDSGENKLQIRASSLASFEMHESTAGEWRKALVLVVLSFAPTALCKGGGGGTDGAGAGSSRVSTR